MNVPTNIDLRDEDYKTPLSEVEPGQVCFLPQFPGKVFLRMAPEEGAAGMVQLARLDNGAEVRLPELWKCAACNAGVTL